MSPPVSRVDPGSFELLYRDSPDPWGFATSWYEQRKYQLTLKMLPSSSYRRCFEPAAANGDLSALLAERCEHLVTIEGSQTAATFARERFRSAPNVDVRWGIIPDDWPEDTFDLIVLSELGYYFDHSTLLEIATRCDQSLRFGNCLMAVHWLGHSDDHLLHGDEVHRVLESVFGIPTGSYREHSFRIEYWQRSEQ